MTPGDQWTDPLIKRGEWLERERDVRALTEAEKDELLSIKLIAHARLAHTTQYPLASTSLEESAQDLSEERQRDCDSVAEVLRRFVKKYGRAVVEAAVVAVITKR